MNSSGSIRFNSVSDTITSALQKQIDKKIEAEIEKIKKEIQKQVPVKMQSIKNEILGSFQTIALTQVQKVFIETYGDNYDVESLNASLTLGLGNNLRPIFLYDQNKFMFNTTLKKMKENSIKMQGNMLHLEIRQMNLNFILRKKKTLTMLIPTHLMKHQMILQRRI